MANKSIGDYTAAGSIDATADYFLIQQSGVYKKINRNTILALASAPLGTTDIQSPTNKTFDNTNSLTIKDGSLTIQNSAGTTKQAVFSAASITAGQTRTFTFPDASGTITTIAGTQTLTNKTLTSPAITGGTIDNSTVTVDSIAGHTVATTVTVANLQIANGVLNTANAVTATAVAAGAIQPQALIAGTGSGWATTSFTPSWTNLTPGSGTNQGYYIQIGKIVWGYFYFALGVGSSVGSTPYFAAPINESTKYTTGSVNWIIGQCWIESNRVLYNGTTIFNGSHRLQPSYVSVSGSATQNSALTATAPNTFSSGGDYLAGTFMYEVA